MRAELLASITACLVFTQSAYAQVAAPQQARDPATTAVSPADRREQLIEQGLELREQGRDHEALARFQEALTMRKDARVLAQIAFAEEALGRWAQSYLHLKEALANRGDPWIAERAEFLQQHLEGIQSNVGRLEVRTNVSISKLTVDGVEVGHTPLSEPLVLTAGTVVITAYAPSYLPATRQVVVHGGTLSRTELVLVPEPAVRTIRDRVVTPAKVIRNPAWLYVAGGGALVSIASLGPYLRADKLMADLKRDCTPVEQGDCSDYQDREARIERLDRTYQGLLYGGIGVAAVGIATYFLWTKEQAPKIAPAASITRDSASFTLRGFY